MSSHPRADDILQAYEDQSEALRRLLRLRRALIADVTSRFYGLTESDLQLRLEEDANELERWSVMMLIASFEATIRTDMEERIRRRTRDTVRKPFRDLQEKHGLRIRLDDILAIWEICAGVKKDVIGRVTTLLKHRHWLAHGRYWTNKYGKLPSPHEARMNLDDYEQAIKASVPDFPRV